MDVQGLIDFIEINKTGFRKALKKHDKVLGPLGHDRLSPVYMPTVEASFPEKNRLRLQVLGLATPLNGMCLILLVPLMILSDTELG